LTYYNLVLIYIVRIGSNPTNRKEKSMKKVLLTVCCLLLASMAFAGASRSNPDMNTPPTSIPDGGSFLGKADVLYVNDTGGGTWDGLYNGCYQDACTAVGLSVDDYDTSSYGDGPDATTMADYNLVIWNCYDCWWSGDSLTTNDVTNLTTYVSGGGNLWLIGQDINYSAPGNWTTFRNTYLGVSSVTDDIFWDVASCTVDGATGTFTEPHTNIDLVASQCFTANNFYTDNLTVGAAFISYIVDGTYTSAACYDNGTYKTAYYTIHLECYTDGDVALEDMIIDHLSWFGILDTVQPTSLGNIKAMFN